LATECGQDDPNRCALAIPSHIRHIGRCTEGQAISEVPIPAPFLKMNGLGNEIIVADMRGRADRVTAAAAIALNADPVTKFDQVMAVHDARTPGTSYYIEIVNSDGSRAQACGNGMRCVTQALANETGQSRFTFETVAGILFGEAEGDGQITVDWAARASAGTRSPWRRRFADTTGIELQIGPIDEPMLHPPRLPRWATHTRTFWVKDDVWSYALDRFGPMLENHPSLPERANISIALRDVAGSYRPAHMGAWRRADPRLRDSRVRRVGERCTAAGRTSRKATVTLPGGDLVIEWRSATTTCCLPARQNMRRRPVRSCRRLLDAGNGGRRLMAIETLTFGCRLNAYESEVVKSEAEKAGLADALIVNTCAVTAEAVRQAKQAIRKARRDNPGRRVASLPAAPRKPRGAPSATWPKSTLVIGNEDKIEGRKRHADCFWCAAQRQGASQRHHERAGNRRAPD